MTGFARAAIVVCIVAVTLAAVPGALGAGGYGLDSPSTVDVPDGVVSGEGELFTVREIARVPHGEPFRLRTAAPAGAAYGVELRDMNGGVVEVSNRTLRGNDSISFATGDIRPGSYVAVLSDHGGPQAVLPVVIEGYAVSVDAPETAEAGADLTVSATLVADPAAPDVGEVELAIVDRASGEVAVQRAATADRGGYSATVRLDDPGEYDVFVNVRGARSTKGHKEVLGFSDARTLSVTAPSSPPGDGAAATDADDAGAATPSGTATPSASTTVPEGVITRNATVGPSTPGEDPSTAVLSMAFTLFLAAGLGLLLWTRR